MGSRNNGIWQDQGGLTTQRIDNKVRERIWEIAQSIRIINQQGAGLEQWDLLINRCVTRLSEQESKRLLWKWYIAIKTNLDGHTLKAARHEFADVVLRRRNNQLEETPTKKRKLMYIGIHFIAVMIHCLFLKICRSRRQRGIYLRS
jgi:hypothetical protein